MGVWRLLGLGGLGFLEEAVVVTEVIISAGRAVEAEGDRFSNKA